MWLRLISLQYLHLSYQISHGCNVEAAELFLASVRDWGSCSGAVFEEIRLTFEVGPGLFTLDLHLLHQLFQKSLFIN